MEVEINDEETFPSTEHEIVEDEEMCISGKIIGCNALNVRKNPSLDSEILCIIDNSTEFVIDNKDFKSNEWTKICVAAGIEGYVISEFVTNN